MKGNMLNLVSKLTKNLDQYLNESIKEIDSLVGAPVGNAVVFGSVIMLIMII